MLPSKPHSHSPVRTDAPRTAGPWPHSSTASRAVADIDGDNDADALAGSRKTGRQQWSLEARGSQRTPTPPAAAAAFFADLLPPLRLRAVVAVVVVGGEVASCFCSNCFFSMRRFFLAAFEAFERSLSAARGTLEVGPSAGEADEFVASLFPFFPFLLFRGVGSFMPADSTTAFSAVFLGVADLFFVELFIVRSPTQWLADSNILKI
jgi:hypothetical protein